MDRRVISSPMDTVFEFDYGVKAEDMRSLYEKAKRDQWNATRDIAWATPEPDDGRVLADELVDIYGSPIWNKMSEKEQVELNQRITAWRLSVLVYGEQGALLACSQLVDMVSGTDQKFFQATQVMDEARHVEAYSRLLHDKFELAYPITHGLRSLLESGLSDSRWDMTYLTMQILIEGLALAAFQRIRDQSKNPLAAAVNAYVMQDEARHVAFGRLALRDYYPQLSDAERNEREEFVVQACWHMRDRFNQKEVWERLGLPVDECIEILDHSETMQLFRSRLFTRIVPTVKDIGLWGPKVQEAFAAMGAIEFAKIDAAALLDNDARVAEDFDAKMRLKDASVAAE